MKVLIVLSDNTFPPDFRVQKETRSLIAAGHRISLIAKMGKKQSKIEDVEGVKVIRLRLFPEIPLLGFLWYQTISSHSLFFYMLFFCLKERIELLHVHDLPLALVTVLVGKITNKPVIFDLHEDYCAMEEYAFGFTKKRRLLLYPLIALWKIKEIISLHLSTYIIVTAKEHIKRLAQLHVNENKITVIPNVADTNRLSNLALIKKGKQKDFIICYVGGFSRHRGLEDLVEAMRYILKYIPKVHLMLIGDGPKRERNRIVCQVKKMGLGKSVSFTGWIEFEEAMKYIQMANICVIPHKRTKHTETTLPHKLFQYMFFQKPVLVSNCKPMKRICLKHKCGLVFEAGNPRDLADKIIYLATHPSIAREMGNNGRKAVIKKYNWKNASKALYHVYQQLDSGVQ